MFLISLILFPVISGYIFNLYKNKIIELNGVIKFIGIIGLFLLTIFGYSNVFDNAEIYLLVIIIWYVLVFIFYYFKIATLQLKNINKLKYNNFSYLDGILKISFFIFIFILYINMDANYHINNMFGFFRNNNSLISFAFIGSFGGIFILFGVFFQFIDMIKNSFFRRIFNNIKSQKKLKEDLKIEILSELRK